MTDYAKMTNDELSAAVAEKVMGWRLIDRKLAGWGDGPRVWGTHDPEAMTYQDFTPASSWHEAGMVVEQLRRKYQVTIVVMGETVLVDVIKLGGKGPACIAVKEHRSFPRAVCLAAMEAHVREVEHAAADFAAGVE